MARTDLDVRQLYNGNGSNTDFAIPFEYEDEDFVQVYVRDTSVSPPTETLKTVVTHYTLTGATATTLPTTVSFLVAPSATDKVLVIKKTTKTQAINLLGTDKISSVSITDALDKLTDMVQELQEQMDRCIKVPKTNTQTNIELPTTLTNDGILQLNSTSTGIVTSLTGADFDGLDDAVADAQAAQAAAEAAQTAAETAETNAETAEANAEAAAASISGLTTGRVVVSTAGPALAAATTTTAQVQGLVGLTASRGVLTDGSSILTSATATSGQINALSGLSNTRLVQSDVSGLLASVAAITASRALISDSNGIPTHSTVTNTELALLAGLSALTFKFFHLQDVKSNGTNGGGFTSGSWVTRDINTETWDVDGIVTISSNAWTPVSGTYIFIGFAPALGVNDHRVKIVRSDSPEVQGHNQYAGNAGPQSGSVAIVVAGFTANGSQSFTLQHRCSTTQATYGLGEACSFTSAEIYGSVIGIKIA